MAVNEALAARVREALLHTPKVEEKKMFGGIAFMVDGKMCISVSRDRIMCRIDPGLHDQEVQKEYSRTVIMKGRKYKGYIYVEQEGLRTRRQLDHWVQLALDFNSRAKASVKKNEKIKG